MISFDQIVPIGTFTCYYHLRLCVNDLINKVGILILKGIQICYYSTTNAGYYYYDRTIDGQNTSRFSISSYVIFQLWFGMILWAFYYLFNIIFNEQHSPCFGGDNWTLLTETLLTDRIAVIIYLDL